MERVKANAGSGNTIPVGRTVVVFTILFIIALIHLFRVGSYLRGPLFTLYYSYFSDIVIPFGVYFLLCLNETYFPFLRDWRLKALLVFIVASSTEVAQAFGIPILGETFDPLDFLMFAGGVLLAALTDELVFGRLLPFWSPKAQEPAGGTRKKSL